MQMDTELALDYTEDFVYTLGLATRAVQVGCCLCYAEAVRLSKEKNGTACNYLLQASILIITASCDLFCRGGSAYR